MAFRAIPPIADYIVVGGGTAGLVVASRLSEDRDAQVVVLESGPNRTEDPTVRNPSAWPTLSGSELDWHLKIVPQAGLNNRPQEHPAGKVLGGTAAISGNIFIPPSPAGIDAWAAMGNPRWNWQSLVPYLKKAYTISPPPISISLQGHVDQGADGNGPIQVTYPALADEENYGFINAWRDAFQQLGYEYTSEFLSQEKTVGTRPYTATIDPRMRHRSSADSQYAARAHERANLTIVTNATVRRILFSNDGSKVVATGVEVMVNSQITTIKANKEVILAAGALHTPKLLELSGIGERSRLADHGIPLVVENPGVGENLQNHFMTPLPIPLADSPETEYLPQGFKTSAFIRLEPDKQKVLLDQFLPESKQHSAHEQTIRSILTNPDEASACLLLAIMPGNYALLGLISCYPFSRGNTHIASADPEEKPIIDPRVFSHPLDIELMAHHLYQLHDILSSPAFEPYFDEIPPPPTDMESMKDLLREKDALNHHSCGTAAMLPREQGGVVDEMLKVYGTENLRIVDASVFPLVPHANTMAPVYGVAERAADIIRGRIV